MMVMMVMAMVIAVRLRMLVAVVMSRGPGISLCTAEAVLLQFLVRLAPCLGSPQSRAQLQCM